MTMFGVAAADRPGHRPDAGRLAHGQLQLALDLPHQPPDRPPRLPDVPLRGRGPRLPQAGAGGAAPPAAQLRLHRPGAARPGHVPAGRSCSARGRSGTGSTTRSGGSRRWSSCSSLGLGALIFREMRIANPVVNFRPLGERNLAASCVIIFCAYGVLYGASVCLPGLLQSLFGYDAFVSGPGDVALGRLLHPDDARRRRPPRPGHRRPLADRRGPARHGGRVLLDGADEPAHQPVAGGLAAGGADRRPVDDLRPDQRGGLPVHPPAPARGGGRPVRPAPQRGGQRRHVDQQDHRAAARAVPPGPRGRVPRARSTRTCSPSSSEARPSSCSRRATRPGRSR